MSIATATSKQIFGERRSISRWVTARLAHFPAQIDYVVAMGIVAAATAAGYIIISINNESRLAVLFLVSVLLSALYLGTKPGLFAAILAFLAHNFFILPHRYEFQFVFPNAIITMSMFLLTALAAGGMASRVRQEARRAEERAQTLSLLFEASRGMSDATHEDELRDMLVDRLSEVAGGEAIVIDEDGRPVARNHAASRTATGDWSQRELRAGGREMGLARWRRAGSRATEDETDGLLRILTDLGAAAIARCRLGEEKADMEAVAKTEKLRTALLASISHDLRTPLTTILASATSLIDYREQFDEAVRDDLLANIRGEAKRLDRFLSNLLQITRLESGALVVAEDLIDLRQVVDRVIQQISARAGGRAIRVEVKGKAPIVRCDPVLLEIVLGNVIENAVNFAPDDLAIDVVIAHRGDLLVVEVSDLGPGVPVEQRQKIFDKFYRISATAGAAPGTGLGLPISRGLIEAMGGSIEALARADRRAGLRIRVALPKPKTAP